MGNAKFVNAHEILVTKQDGSTETLKTKNTIIATGASAAASPASRSTGRKW